MIQILTLEEFWKGKQPVEGRARRCDKCEGFVTRYIEDNRYSVYCPECAVAVYDDYVDAKTNGGF